MHLYSKRIMQESREPAYTGVVLNATHSNSRSNPLCGDRIQWTMRLVEDCIVEMRHHTRGCALCMASASILAQQMVGSTKDDVVDEIDSFVHNMGVMLTQEGAVADDSLSVFLGLRHAPSRRSCVLLPWEGLKAMLLA